MPLSAAANQKQLLLTQGNCFAVFCFEDDKPILGSVIRIDDFRDEPLQSFLPRSIETIFGVEVTGAACDIYSEERWGRAAYMGDMKTTGNRGLGARGYKILRLVSAYGHFRTFSDYQTDVHYCYLRRSDYRIAEPYGFTSTIPYVWMSTPDVYKDGSPHYIAKLNTTELPIVMAGIWRLLPDMFAVHDQPVFEVVSKNAAGGL